MREANMRKSIKSEAQNSNSEAQKAAGIVTGVIAILVSMLILFITTIREFVFINHP